LNDTTVKIINDTAYYDRPKELESNRGRARRQPLA
jgi:hypothetical protein